MKIAIAVLSSFLIASLMCNYGAFHRHQIVLRVDSQNAPSYSYVGFVDTISGLGVEINSDGSITGMPMTQKEFGVLLYKSIERTWDTNQESLAQAEHACVGRRAQIPLAAHRFRIDRNSL